MRTENAPTNACLSSSHDTLKPDFAPDLFFSRFPVYLRVDTALAPILGAQFAFPHYEAYTTEAINIRFGN